MKNKKIKEIEPILEEVKGSLQKIYGDKLKGVILYGSYARGDATEGSDIDLILLLDKIEDPVLEMEKYFDAIWKLDLKYDTVISILPIGEEEFRIRRRPVLLNAKKEGLVIFGYMRDKDICRAVRCEAFIRIPRSDSGV